jgi:hypothetical protein
MMQSRILLLQDRALRYYPRRKRGIAAEALLAKEDLKEVQVLDHIKVAVLVLLMTEVEVLRTEVEVLQTEEVGVRHIKVRVHTEVGVRHIKGVALLLMGPNIGGS